MKKVMNMIALLLALPLLMCGCGGDEMPSTEFSMTAEITAIGERIEVEVIESENEMVGPFWVITGEETVYATEDGDKLSRSDLAEGDVLVIYYGGQVMMSYPPQIVASGIVRK